jgi:taurine dioxygenase
MSKEAVMQASTSVSPTLSVKPTGAPLGADVAGADLSRPLDDATFSLIRQAWDDHLVLRFRNQRLSDDDLVRFSERFGVLDRAPIHSSNVKPEEGYISVISNVKVEGQPIGELGSYEAVWHTDMSYMNNPPIGSLLYALEVPKTGGDTGFANMYLAFERLPEILRSRLSKLSAKHDSSHSSVGHLRRGFKEVDDPRDAPGAVHAMVLTHPNTGRKALYLGRRRNAYVLGLSLEESEQLLDVLWQHATRDEFTWYQKWQPGDLIMWDNRCTMHRRDAFDPSTRRVMHRTQISARPSSSL